jgi:hypothetical protein
LRSPFQVPFEIASRDMSTEMSRVCLACGVPLGANRANEHIIADWLLTELGNTEEQLTQIIANSLTCETKEARQPHVMSSFKEGRVCGACNNGWMSTLEANAQTVLVPYINVDRNITQISESDALVVARWTLKTAVILSHAIPLQKPLPTQHLGFLREDPLKLPAQVGIFAAVTGGPQVTSAFCNEIIG